MTTSPHADTHITPTPQPPGEHLTLETRLARIEERLDARFDESMAQLITWADHVEECLRMVDTNRETGDNITEIILRHLGVDMSNAGSPPRMTAEEVAFELGVEWPVFARTACDEPDREPVTAVSKRPSLDPGITMPYLDTRGLSPEVQDALTEAANAVGRHMRAGDERLALYDELIERSSGLMVHESGECSEGLCIGTLSDWLRRQREYNHE